MLIKGSCSCGNVAYKIESNLTDAASCHCSMCRKASGSQSSAFASFETDKFSWLSGETQLNYYKSTEDMGTYFCSNCGSTLCGTYKDDVCWVTLGCIDGDPEITVGKHIYMGSKVPWETSPNDVNQYDEFPNQNP